MYKLQITMYKWVCKALYIIFSLALLVLCVSCSSDVSNPDATVSVDTVVDETDIGDANTPESPQNTNGNEQTVIETATAPSPEPTISPPQELEPTHDPDQTILTDTPEAIPETTPSSAPSPTPEIPAESSAQEQPLPSPTPETASPAPTPTPPPSPIPTDDEPVVLTIRGDGVSAETTWTLKQLQAMWEGYREYTYSTTNNWPSYGHTAANGISLPYLLGQAGMLSNAAGFKFSAADGYQFTVTYNQIFGTRYAFANHTPSGSSGASAVEPVIAWEFGDVGRVREENLRIFFGQSGPQEVNTAAFVSDLILIEVSTAPQSAWGAPEASIADGSAVPTGTELSLTHDSMDNIRIYYTLDGSEPDYDSLVYNRSASYFQPELTVPLVLTEDITVKAFAAGLGREPSQVVTFSYTIDD